MPTPEELKYFTALRGVIAEKMGEKEGDDRVYCATDNRSQEWVDCCEYCGECRGDIRLPLAIDPENPERGLLGMCDPPVQLTPIYNPHQNNVVIYWEATWSEERCMEFNEINVSGETPTLALLKALVWQEGVEVV